MIHCAKIVILPPSDKSKIGQNLICFSLDFILNVKYIRSVDHKFHTISYAQN